MRIRLLKIVALQKDDDFESFSIEHLSTTIHNHKQAIYARPNYLGPATWIFSLHWALSKATSNIHINKNLQTYRETETVSKLMATYRQ